MTRIKQMGLSIGAAALLWSLSGAEPNKQTLDRPVSLAFAWISDPPREGSRIGAEIESRLENLGLHQGDTNPDLYLIRRPMEPEGGGVTTSQDDLRLPETAIESYSRLAPVQVTGFPSWHLRTGSPKPLREVTLYEVVDAHTKQLLWRALVREDDLDSSNTAAARKRTARLIQSAFRDFPEEL